MTRLRRGACGWMLLAVLLDAGLGIPARSSQTGKPEDPEKKAEGQQNRKKVYTNEDLIQLRDKRKEGASPSSTLEVPSASPEKTWRNGPQKDMSLSGYRDLNGHDREYWRKKVKPLRTQLDGLSSQIAALRQKQSEVGNVGGVRVSKNGRLRAASKDNQQNLSRRLGELERKQNLALKSIQDLEEEARKAQALPEWLR